MGVFSTCVIALDLTTSVSFKKKVEIKKKILDNGGIVSFIVTKKTTHVVGNDPEKFDVSSKCRMAVKYGIPVVSPEYVSDAIRHGQLPLTDEYIIGGRSKTSDFKSGKITALTPKTEQRKKTKSIFSIKGVKVWQYGDNKAPFFDEDKYEVAKYAMFEGYDKKTDAATFFVVEIHVTQSQDQNKDSEDPRFRVYTHHGSLKDAQEGYDCCRECRYAKTSEEILAIFGNVHKEQTLPGKKMAVVTGRKVSRNIGSPKLQKILAELPSESNDLDPHVSDLVEHVWREVAGEITEVITMPVDKVKMDQLEKAEAILMQIQDCLMANKTDQLNSLTSDFYEALPHRCPDQGVSKQWVATKLDLCQLIRDMISVSEATNWSTRSSTEAKYRALRCNIGHLESHDPQHKLVRDLVESSIEGDLKMEIKAVYEVQRPIEETNFRHDIDPKRLLFHASRPENFVGILSRGLLLPKVVVENYGGQRSDAGMLGGGLYFASAASTSAQYSRESKTKGTRLMLVADVALGQCKDLFNHDRTLKCPPEGYHSVHGVKNSPNTPSDFMADEYAVYCVKQQRLRYLVEFSLQGDQVRDVILADIQQDLEQTALADMLQDNLDLSDVLGIEDPLSKVEAGLVSEGNKMAVELQGVHIRSKLVDLAAQVIVLQEYYNTSDTAVEAKYVFPLDDMAAVCGFEAFINDKHIIGEVKEKEQAHKEYKKAVSEGHGAYLMDRDEETPDVFTVSVGNLPPHASVLIKITYVAELQVEAELISFRLPGSVAPWKQDSAADEITQTELETHKVQSGDTTVQVAVEMPFDIRSIQCPSHKVRIKRTAAKAVVQMCHGQSIQDGFQLLIGLAEIHVPRMWVERHPGETHQACMLTFYPEFEADEDDDVEIVFVLDLSNSMSGDAVLDAKKLLMMLLHNLPPRSTFNVLCFGTGHRELFATSQSNTNTTIQAVETFLKTACADMGNTEVFKPLHSYHLLASTTATRNIFIISDGHFNNEDSVLNAVLNNATHTRVFTLGVSSTANMHLLRAIARVGGGAFEFFDRKAKSKWERKVKSQLSKASQPGLTSVAVEWQQFDNDAATLPQAPRQITALFNGSRQVVYGLVPNCTMATLKAVVGGQEVSTVVSTSELSITTGMIVHRLTARSLIRDWEDGMLSADRTQHEILKLNLKNYVIDLSKEYSIVTQFTSFVAIETRDEDEKKGLRESGGPSIFELVSGHSMDILDYMGWEGGQGRGEDEQVGGGAGGFDDGAGRA
ncbi:protein mono-ADP-ribosyltransferase PARP4-like [Haliotis rubra]|uniref:protein mono-ADP-ribosyltransferase PARP4-like n=1 Tax=Haliotis rubra TaxID=36100 RepID=UPI001EE5F36A|nr:protein mono-ADP-ribosyltransferase PARP4-like [Haliotis rubra]